MDKIEKQESDSKPIRVFLAKTSMDGHWIGIAVVGKALRDAGMEVIYGGVLDAAQIISSAAQEDADVIGLNIGGSYAVVDRLLALLSLEQDFKPVVVAGGTVPPPDIALLKSRGVDEIFPPGSRLDHIVAYIQSAVQERA